LQFEYNLEDNIFYLYDELKNKTYQHSNYTSFYIKDPKLRHIHKACVKDGVLHRAIFRILYPVFDKHFIFDSYSCRNDKGTHRAINRLNDFARKRSKNNTKNCFVLKCDVRKFFDSIDHKILLGLLHQDIGDENTNWLLGKIIESFSTATSKGIPLGNITSQLFANVYLNELDKFIKHKLRIKYYIRYCDDFVILSQDKKYLENLIPPIDDFLENNLKLFLHPDKISIRKYHQGIDFLGYVSFPYHEVLRTKTKNRIIKNLRIEEEQVKSGKLSKKSFNDTVQSYLGVLKHCDSLKVKRKYFYRYLGMIIFLYGEDDYRAKEKLNEIVGTYKTKHKSGLNLVWFDAKEKGFSDFADNFKVVSMFQEKKLVVLKSVFLNAEFQEEFLKELKKLENSKDIIVVFEKEAVDQRNKLFKTLKKDVKCQEFKLLSGNSLLNWIKKEFEKNNSKTDFGIENLILNRAGNDLWQLQNEIKKIASFKRGKIVKKQDVELLVKPKIENDIFKTIDALAQKNKKQALTLLHKHLENGDSPLYLLSMMGYQFRGLLTIKELMEQKKPYEIILKKSGLHPFVVRKNYFLCRQFSFEELKKIYLKIFQIDSDIKTGKIEPETALDMFVSAI